MIDKITFSSDCEAEKPEDDAVSAADRPLEQRCNQLPDTAS